MEKKYSKINDSEFVQKMSHASVEQAMDAIFWVDNRGFVVRINEAASRMTGFPPEELLGMQVLDFDIAFPYPDFNSFFQDLDRERKTQFESKIRSKDNKIIYVNVSAYKVCVGKEDYVCGTVRDMTQERCLHLQIEENEKLLKAIFNHHFQLTGLIDTEGYLLMANETALKLLDIKESDAIGKLFWETPWFAHSEKEQQKVKRSFERAVEGEFVRWETIMLDSKGNILNVDNSFKPIYDELGEVKYIVPEGRDITEQVEARRKLEEMFSELNELKNQLQEENKYLQEEMKSEHDFWDMIGNSTNFKKIVEQIEQVAATDSTVLILGETGTGKELIARALHNLSGRKERPLVKVNCAALPAQLIESELFGYEKGAFTGALTQKIGRFELADEGTIFLDEIGDLPLELQSKLLRILQEGEFERLGNPNTKKVNVRIIAATNRELDKLVLEGNFREDLYYRLNVFPITSPPLRERREDIPLLIKHFLKKFNQKLNKNISEVPVKVINKLTGYNWPGNIRELENLIERASIISKGTELELGDWFCAPTVKSSRESAKLEDLEKIHILKVLESVDWRVSGQGGAAEILGLKNTTLFARMKKLGIQKP